MSAEQNAVEGLSEGEREDLQSTDDGHDWPTETDDGLVMRCRCGATPPSHFLGQQVDEAMWLWEHRRRERFTAVERIVAARVRLAVDEFAAKVERRIEEAQASNNYRAAIYHALPDNAHAFDQSLTIVRDLREQGGKP